MARKQWVRMRVGNKSALLRLLDNKLAHALDLIIDQAKEDGTWISSEEQRLYFQTKINVSPPTFYRYIKQLISKGILIPQPGRGVYKLNIDLIRFE